jgi:hypothetical protein
MTSNIRSTKLLRPALLMLAVLGLLGPFSASTLAAQAEGPGWELSATTDPTNLVHGVDEVQEVVASPEEATFTLSFEEHTTTPIPYGATAATVQAALVALPGIGKGNVTVAGTAPGSYSVTFIATLGDMEVGELGAAGATASVQTLGAASGTIAINVFNVGAGQSNGTVTVTDTLPPGVKAKQAGELRKASKFGEDFGVDPQIVGEIWDCTGNGPGVAPHVAGATVVSCTNDPVNLPIIQGGGGVPAPVAGNHPNPQPAVGISVEADAEASGLTNHVSIAGGGALIPASTEDPVTISSKAAPGGLTQADVWFSNADGTPDTQAGSHPYLATFVFDLATTLTPNSLKEGRTSGSEIRDLETRMPAGLLGNLSGTPTCTRQQLLRTQCPATSMVGELFTEFTSAQFEHPVFNMVPAAGEPAELGFSIEGIPVFVSFSVRTGGDYGITAHIDNIAQKEVLQSVLTLWGVPADHTHDYWRAEHQGGCSEQEIADPILGKGGPFSDGVDYCAEQQGAIMQPILTLPTACAGPQPFVFRELSGWQEPDAKSEARSLSHDASDQPVGFAGCENLGAEPTITTLPDTARTDAPSGLTVEVKPPLGGLEEPGVLRTADLQNATVTFPEGFVINPGQASGLQACGPLEDALTTGPEQEHGEENDNTPTCPSASQIGTVTIQSPLILGAVEKQFAGSIYLLQSNPPEVKLLVAASADGVNLKLVGVVHLNEQTGRLETRFEGTPQLPFSDLKLSFNGGAQAALATPTQCGTYTTSADFTPWSSPFAPDFLTNAAFMLTEGSGGGACPSNPLPFAPSLTAGTGSDQAGGFTAFSTVLQRGDGQQRIEKLQFKAPAGLSAVISSVQRCDEADANAGTCSAASRIGHALVTAGPGANPLVLPQPGGPELPIYLTGPYGGAPFGLSIVTPAIAGPFNLGTIVTRASIAVDPSTAQITVTTDPLPQIVKGVPTDLRSIEAVIDRPGFMFNPTNCDAQEFTGTATSVGGAASAAISSHFGVGSCRGLEFHPKFSASTIGKASKANGAGLTVKLSFPAAAQGTQVNIAKVKVDLPIQLPTRQSTLSKACLAKVFEANPASCPKESDVGAAVARTPILAQPLRGPAYLVSHGGAAFPDLEIVLQGEGVTLVLDGHTNIKKGVTSSEFATVPDAPISSFELNLPIGKFSVLAPNLPASAKYSFCGQKLTMPTTLTAQNGAVLNQTTKVGVTGCAKPKAATRAQKLAATLKACRKKAKGKRAGCERSARKRYGVVKKVKKRG